MAYSNSGCPRSSLVGPGCSTRIELVVTATRIERHWLNWRATTASCVSGAGSVEVMHCPISACGEESARMLDDRAALAIALEMNTNDDDFTLQLIKAISSPDLSEKNPPSIAQSTQGRTRWGRVPVSRHANVLWDQTAS